MGKSNTSTEASDDDPQGTGSSGLEPTSEGRLTDLATVLARLRNQRAEQARRDHANLDEGHDDGRRYSNRYFESLEEFISDFVGNTFHPTPEEIWCPDWAEHDEARSVLESLWIFWEAAKSADLESSREEHMQSYLNGFYQLMSWLVSADGPFENCREGHLSQAQWIDRLWPTADQVRAQHESDDSVYEPVDEDLERIDARMVKARLKNQVYGQDEVIHRVAKRLELTSAQLVLRPDRPKGVFLFVGPSGCGKTELAYAIAEQQYGDRSEIIRLDMSEYSHQSEVARFTGCAPGYLGSDQPQSWLTTRVIENPRSVVLLDEIEKANPSIYPLLLGVMDAGRLTDGSGATADFSETVLIMTSNLGAREYSKMPTGFGRDSATADSASATKRVSEAVEDHFAPEFINRLDQICFFSTLGHDVLRRIVERDVGTVVEQMRRVGYELEIDEMVLDAIVNHAQRPEHGARVLHRTIENELVSPALDEPKGRLRAILVAGPGQDEDLLIRWEPAA